MVECGMYGCKGEMVVSEIPMFGGEVNQIACPLCSNKWFELTAEQVRPYFTEEYTVEPHKEKWYGIRVSKGQQYFLIRLNQGRYSRLALKIEGRVLIHPTSSWGKDKTYNFQSFPKAVAKIKEYMEMDAQNKATQGELKRIIDLKAKQEHETLLKEVGLNVETYSHGVDGKRHTMEMYRDGGGSVDIITGSTSSFVINARNLDMDTIAFLVKVLKERGFKDNRGFSEVKL